MFSLSVSVLSYQRKAEIGDSCGTTRHLPLSSLLKSTLSNLYFLLYRSSRLCCDSNDFPGYYGMYGFTWSISVRVRLLFTSLVYFFVISCHSQGGTVLHDTWYLLSIPGLFNSKVPLLLVPGPLSRSEWRVGKGPENEVALVPGSVKRPGSSWKCKKLTRQFEPLLAFTNRIH